MSELSLWVAELRDAIAQQHAHPLPCSGNQAFARDVRVFLARRAVLQLFSRG